MTQPYKPLTNDKMSDWSVLNQGIRNELESRLITLARNLSGAFKTAGEFTQQGLFFSDAVLEGMEYVGLTFTVWDRHNDPTLFTDVWASVELVWGPRTCYLVYTDSQTAPAQWAKHNLAQLWEVDKVLKLLDAKITEYATTVIPTTAQVILKPTA